MSNKLESIVPPLELCREVAEKWPGAFADSALVWTPHGVRSIEELLRSKYCKDLPIRKMTVPAPTLAEIQRSVPGGLEVMYDECCVRSRLFESGGEPIHAHWNADENESDAAMRVWLMFQPK